MTPTSESEISRIIAAARSAFASWSISPLEDRIKFLRALEQHYRDNKEKIAAVISAETGKPLWESRLEVDSMAAKIPISIEAHAERSRDQSRTLPDATGRTRFRPHGVLAVLGPFNMPGHLPNGHIVPALLAGNTVIFKPSEQTPKVGQILADAFTIANFPVGVFNIVQGGKETGAVLAKHPGINGVLFTGSTAGGIALRRVTADHPGKILALEMGGNNPLIVHQTHDLTAAAYIIIQSAFITAGQRCSCARRLILIRGEESVALMKRLMKMMQKIRVGLPTDEPPAFMGPVISADAAKHLLAAQENFMTSGGVVLVKMSQSSQSPALLTPGLIDVTGIAHRPDVELFGPLLQIIRVNDFDEAIREANNTAYGLSAGLISDNADLYEKFAREIRAGVLAWNKPLTGASSQLPFGGIGQSGNHRPGGYFAADYASYSVASLETPRAQIPAKLPPGIEI
ncbi:MAG TPA: succinylglutamate-semialdehyde dehydrogenase [Tepidisphaeraceae bacterium]|jgi:succinylglutamic semialdehyde dehydrogenase